MHVSQESQHNDTVRSLIGSQEMQTKRVTELSAEKDAAAAEVCMYICMCVYKCTRICMHVKIHMYVCIQMYTHMHACQDMQTKRAIELSAEKDAAAAKVCMYICMCVYKYTHICMHVKICKPSV
jgi:hypothetical protein